MDLKVFVLLALSYTIVNSASLNGEDNEVYDDENNAIIPRGVVRVYQGYIIMKENVEVDTIKNFVVVEAPQIGDYERVTIIHDYNLSLTLAVYPASKHCYVFDRYTDIPEDIFYWFSFRDSTMTTKAFDGKHMGRYKNHLYRITEVNTDRAILTPKMREYCSDDMELRKATMMTVDDLSPGSDEPLGDFEDKHLIYMPYVPVPGERVKRSALARKAPHCCSGGVAR